MILAGFATMVGVLTAGQVRGQFNDEVRSAVDGLQGRLHLKWVAAGKLNCDKQSLSDYVSAEYAQVRIFDDAGTLLCTQSESKAKLKGAAGYASATPNFAAPVSTGTVEQLGYRVVVRTLGLQPSGEVSLLYARPLSEVDHTIGRVDLILLLGVLGGTVLALIAGRAAARRAMRPIVELGDAAREIERTRDPSRRLPHPEADDEVAELARTLEGMLGALDGARGDTQAMLDRQREFVADASHELRTPLTSVLANLELLTEELEGERAETAEAALRSTRRMRRLVGDLLLLARADAQRVQPYRPTDLGEVLVEAASELGPMSQHHVLLIDAEPAIVAGVRDELHRLVLNLLENAVRHTPPGTRVCASTETLDGTAVLVVADEGPGIPPELRQRVFERFVRGGRDGGRGSGLGLAIVRAVAESHGGAVALAPDGPGSGTRFVITIPALLPVDGQPAGVPEGADEDDGAARSNGAGRPRGADQTSTTTGSTIGRRRNRS